MKNATTDLLDEAREIKGLSSDYALAKLLDVRTQTISSYRSGRTQLSDKMAVRVSRMMGRSPGPLLAQLASERAKDPEVVKAWKDAAKILAKHSK